MRGHKYRFSVKSHILTRKLTNFGFDRCSGHCFARWFRKAQPHLHARPPKCAFDGSRLFANTLLVYDFLNTSSSFWPSKFAKISHFCAKLAENGNDRRSGEFSCALGSEKAMQIARNSREGQKPTKLQNHMQNTWLQKAARHWPPNKNG